MRRILITAFVASLVAGWADSAVAVFADSMGHYIKRGTRQNEVWPWPYFCPDRAAVREPFAIMVRNGWRRNNLLGSHYFDAATNQLNTAGELHIRWIMTQAPPAHRQVLIERSIDPQVTSARMAAARHYAEEVSLDGNLPHFEETNMMAEGRPASTVDWTNVQFRENMPPPVLPTTESSIISD